jgi:heat shock protein 1/8
MVGKRYCDTVIQNSLVQWPFEKLCSSYGRLFQVKTQSQTLEIEEIYSMFFSTIQGIAESYLNVKIKEAVISVPSHFGDSQRQVTRLSAQSAGLNVLRLINGSRLFLCFLNFIDTTAVAITHDLATRSREELYTLIFDLGGGTLDVALLLIEDGILETKSVAGDTFLGGRDFDNRMVSHFVDEYKLRYHSDDLSKIDIQRLRLACEEAKKTLSVKDVTQIHVPSFGSNNVDFTSSITRKTFERLNLDLFEKCETYVNQVLNDAKIGFYESFHPF